MEKRLYCGAAKRLITPPEEMWPKLAGMMNKPIGGVIDDLSLRVIALGDGETKALFVCTDSGDPIDVQVNLPMIAERTGIPEENILYFCIHTHSSPSDKGGAPGATRKRNPNPDAPRPPRPSDGPYSNFVRERMMEAVDEAVASMRPAEMGFNYGRSYINVNRNQDYYPVFPDGKKGFEHALGFNAEKPVDRTVFAAEFREAGTGRPIAFLVNYAVHCVVMIWNDLGDGKLGISGDIAGDVSRWLEDEYDGAVAMWSSGAAGDANPIMMNQSYYPDPVTGASVLYPIPSAETPKMMLKILASRHYSDVLRTIRGIDTFSAQADIRTAREIAEAPRCRAEKSERGLVFTEDAERRPYRIPLHLVKLGEVAIIGVSGEAYTARGRTIQEASTVKNTVIINHNTRSDRISGGYILDDDTYETCMRTEKTDDFTLMADNFVPGVENFSAMPGTVGPAMAAATEKLFEDIKE